MTPAETVDTAETPDVVRDYSPRLAALFGLWLHGYFARNFDGVRTARRGPAPADPGGPLIVYTNHPSWWDPIHFLLLARRALPSRRMYGPFDAEALGQYGFFRKLGAFGIDASTRRGAAEFLRVSRAILAEDDATLWITAQGEFSDPRTRPVVLRPGLAHLLRRLEGGVVVPLAVEYPFWNERRPEALSWFGEPIRLGPDGRDRSVDDWTELLGHRLAETMDQLASAAGRRDPDEFETLVLGRTGVGGMYDLWRRAVAAFRGRTFRASHEENRR